MARAVAVKSVSELSRDEKLEWLIQFGEEERRRNGTKEASRLG